MRRGWSISTIAIVAAAGALSGVTAAAQGRESKAAPATAASATPPPTGAGSTAPYFGPKKRVAVTKFDAIGAFVAQVGGSDIGGGLTAQLITELIGTGRFVLLERADLPGVLREQELGLAKVATAETAAEAGQVLGAQLLIRGSVTEFEQSAAGKGKQVGISFAGATLGLGGNKVTGRVAIDLRLIDATTGAIVDSRRAEAQVTQRASAADLSAGPLSFGNSSFERTPLGQASREAIARAIDFIVARMETVPWSARVVDVADGEVYVNAGRDTNLRAGQRLVVSTVARELTDPSTGARLGALERRLGEIEVRDVQEKFSVARPITPMRAARGDLVRLVVEDASVPTARDVPGVEPSRAASPLTLETLRQTVLDLENTGAVSSYPVLPIGGNSFPVPPGGMPATGVPTQGIGAGIGAGIGVGIGVGIGSTISTLPQQPPGPGSPAQVPRVP
jgi:curli biogenesis system outer membrane secretion channel CsgG